MRVHNIDYLGMSAVMTDGMRRFGLPELRTGGPGFTISAARPPDLM
jgi:hypothetical protein